MSAVVQTTSIWLICRITQVKQFKAGTCTISSLPTKQSAQQLRISLCTMSIIKTTSSQLWCAITTSTALLLFGGRNPVNWSHTRMLSTFTQFQLACEYNVCSIISIHLHLFAYQTNCIVGVWRHQINKITFSRMSFVNDYNNKLNGSSHWRFITFILR